MEKKLKILKQDTFSLICMPISTYYPETELKRMVREGGFQVSSVKIQVAKPECMYWPVVYWPAWARMVLVREMVASIDLKKWVEQAALALWAHMNLTDMMTEIDLAKSKNGSESQKNDSIKNELKNEVIVCHFFLHLPILCPPLPAQIDPKTITWGPCKVGVHGRGVKPWWSRGVRRASEKRSAWCRCQSPRGVRRASVWSDWDEEGVSTRRGIPVWYPEQSEKGVSTEVHAGTRCWSPVGLLSTWGRERGEEERKHSKGAEIKMGD